MAADKARDEGLRRWATRCRSGSPTARRAADRAAVFDGNAIGGEATWIVGLDTFEAHVADQFDRRVFVAVDPALTAAESRAALEAALAEWPNAELQDQAAVQGASPARSTRCST